MPLPTAPSDRGAPVFVGGTGRSGTTVVARLIGSHPDLHLVPVEVRLHAAQGSLRDAVLGNVEFAWLLPYLRSYWYAPPGGEGAPSGLARLCTRPRYDDALARLERDFATDPGAAAAAFMRDLLGAERWVEMTPANAEAAPALLRMFPDLKLVHMTRGGLDVAASMRHRPWAPDDRYDCVFFWAERFTRAVEGVGQLPPTSVLTLSLEELAVTDREAAYERLRSFLGVDDAPAMRSFFDDEVTAERANVGGWENGITASERERLLAVYAHAGRRLGLADLPADVGLRLRAWARLRSLLWLWRRRRWTWRRSQTRRVAGRVRRTLPGRWFVGGDGG